MSLRSLWLTLPLLLTVLPSCGGDPEEAPPAPAPEVAAPVVGPSEALKALVSVSGETITLKICDSSTSLSVEGDAGLKQQLGALKTASGQVAYVEVEGGRIEGKSAVQLSKISLVEARGQAVACSGGEAAPAAGPSDDARGEGGKTSGGGGRTRSGGR